MFATEIFAHCELLRPEKGKFSLTGKLLRPEKGKFSLIGKLLRLLKPDKGVAKGPFLFTLANFANQINRATVLFPVS